MHSMPAAAYPEWNWARTYRFGADRVIRPTSIDELAAVVREHSHAEATLRCVGSRHSFTGIADAQSLLDVSTLPERFEIAADRRSVLVTGSMTYARLAELLAPAELAVANTASLPHLTIAGATATGTHGSGDRNGNLATSIRSIEIVTSTGEVRIVRRGEPDFDVAAISLGALGAVVAIELDVEPAFEIEQQVHTGLGVSDVADSFDLIFGSAYSVSVFTDWLDRFDLWTKRRTDEPAPHHAELHDGQLARVAVHPVFGQDATGCTPQGSTGSWSTRLPHFRANAVPSVGAEVQSEFFVDRTHARQAILAMHSIGNQLAPAMMTSEIRTVRRDELWLSAQYQRDCCAFHFTWYHDVPAALEASRLVSRTLGRFSPVPHWGKVFDPAQFVLHELFPRLPEALEVIRDWDPTGTFTNQWVQETIHKQN